MSKPKIFVDPAVIGPRELNAEEMSDLSGGAAAAAPIAFVTACGNGLGAVVVVAVATVFDP